MQSDKIINSPRFAELSDQLEQYIEQEEVGAIIGLIYSEGDIIFKNKYGFQNIRDRIPIEYDSIFRIYSMTKPIVAVAALQLWEQGKFQFSDAVSKFIPKFGKLKVFKGITDDGIEIEDMEREVTILDLFTHTSGLSYGMDSNDPIDIMYQDMYKEGRNNQSINTFGDLVDKITDIPLRYQPGNRWHYSISLDVLGHIIEIITDQSLDKYLSKNLLDKLQMKDTDFYVYEKNLSRFVTLYTSSDNKLVEMHNPETDKYLSSVTLLSGGGGMVSTLDDYLKFCKMLLNGGELDGVRILSEETVLKMRTNHMSEEAIGNSINLANMKFADQGFGWCLAGMIKTSDKGSSIPVGTYFWGGAALTDFYIDTDTKSIHILLSQYMPRFNKSHIANNFIRLALKGLSNK